LAGEAALSNALERRVGRDEQARERRFLKSGSSLFANVDQRVAVPAVLARAGVRAPLC
jgi:hypothetical protein